MLAIFLDLETTGLDSTKHNVLEIAFKILDLPTNEWKAEYQSIVKLDWDLWEKRDPLSIEINGFKFDYLTTGKELNIVREDIIDIFTKVGVERGKAVFICQNPAFDRGFFAHIIDVYTQERKHWPYHWLDLASMYWTVRIQDCQQKGIPFPKEIIISKDEIAKHYQLPPEAHPHKAMNGVNHLIQCYQAVLKAKETLDIPVSC